MSDQYITDKNRAERKQKIDPNKGVYVGPRGGMSQRSSEHSSKSPENTPRGSVVCTLEGKDVSMCIDWVDNKLRARYKGSNSKQVIAYIRANLGRPTDIYDLAEDVANKFDLIRG